MNDKDFLSAILGEALRDALKDRMRERHEDETKFKGKRVMAFLPTNTGGFITVYQGDTMCVSLELRVKGIDESKVLKEVSQCVGQFSPDAILVVETPLKKENRMALAFEYAVRLCTEVGEYTVYTASQKLANALAFGDETKPKEHKRHLDRIVNFFEKSRAHRSVHDVEVGTNTLISLILAEALSAKINDFKPKWVQGASLIEFISEVK